jgi:hypothetical protein
LVVSTLIIIFVKMLKFSKDILSRKVKNLFDIHKNIVFPTWNVLGSKWNRWKTSDIEFFKNQI